jgi:hypothetical protein
MLLYVICKVKPLNIYFNQSFKSRKTAIFISPNIQLKVNKNSAFIVLYCSFWEQTMLSWFDLFVYIISYLYHVEGAVVVVIV